jgi:hypothetical protein
VIAYVFWHRPLEDGAADAYESAHASFHRSLARRPPAGLHASVAVRVPEPAWLARRDDPATESASAPSGPRASASSAYEDWYLLEDFTALGVLNEAAVGAGHRSAHDRIAHRSGAGAGAVYRLIEGGADAGSLAAATLAVWVARPPGAEPAALGELLGDGIDARRASLWRRQLVLGPAPEYCVLAAEVPAGVAPTRLPRGWSASAAAREVLWPG